jgi:hypothetical protein
MEVSSRIRSAVLTALGILVALGVVAIASREETASGQVGDRHASDVLLDVLFALYLVGIFAGALILLYMIYLHRKFQHEGVVPRRNIFQSALGMLLFLAIGFAFARRLAGQRPIAPPDVTEQLFPVDTSPHATTSSIDAVADTGFAWIPVILTLTLIAIAVVGWLWGDRWRRRARGELREPKLADAIASALDESLDDLRAERDPRRAVIAAYARLERVLARYGLPRRTSEAPLEYLARMLADLAVTPVAARRLTALFERAKFSHHEVGVEMKNEAIEALETVRDDLRAAEAEAERERQQALGVARHPVAR